MTALIFPAPVQHRLEASVGALLAPKGMRTIDFTQPAGEPALVGPDSVSWRVFKNAAALFIGGVAAVILELAEPRVRSGVWEHTRFRTEPVLRLQRTGLAAMVTVYGARSVAEAMIEGVGRRHAAVRGISEHGQAYRADDPDLLDWVQATASFGFLAAYHRFAAPLSPAERDQFFAEAGPAARLYGARDVPQDVAGWEARLARMLPLLEPSPVIFDFLHILRRAPALPRLARPLQGLLIRAAVEIVPDAVRQRLDLGASHGLRAWQSRIVRAAVGTADRLLITSAPPAQACLRLGLPADHLYRG